MSTSASYLIRLDAVGATAGAVFDCSSLAVVGAQWAMQSGTQGAAEVQIQGSNDGANFVTLEFPETLTSPGHTGAIEASAYRYLRPYVSVASGTSDFPVGKISFYGIEP